MFARRCCLYYKERLVIIPVLCNIYLLLFIESITTNPDKQIQLSSTYDISGMFDIHVPIVISDNNRDM